MGQLNMKSVEDICGPDPLATTLGTLGGGGIGGLIGRVFGHPLIGAAIGAVVGGATTAYATWKSDEEEGDPTLYADRIEVQGRRASKPVPVHGTGGHRAVRFVVRNGFCHAEKGRVETQ